MPEFVFFDGPEDPELLLNCFKEIENYVEIDCVFCMHDWETEKNIYGQTSVKARMLRPYLHKNENWEIVEELSGRPGVYPNDNGKNSVGMVVAKKIK